MTGRSGSKGTCGFLVPHPPGQRFQLNIKAQDHSKPRINKRKKERERKNQDHSKARELPKSSNDTDVAWPWGNRTKNSQQKKPEAEKDSPRGRHLDGQVQKSPPQSLRALA